MKDCSQCVHRGRIVLGKLFCHRIHEEVEPFEGKYEYMAEKCPCYKEVDA